MVLPREILVPTDFSEASSSAFAVARSLADATGARLALVTVVPDALSLSLSPPLGSVGGALPLDVAALEATARASAAATLRALADRLGPRCGATVVVQGHSPWREIVRVAGERGSDWIVLATHGRTGPARAMLGSTAERVVRAAPCAVVTVPVRNGSDRLEAAAPARPSG